MIFNNHSTDRAGYLRRRLYCVPVIIDGPGGGTRGLPMAPVGLTAPCERGREGDLYHLVVPKHQFGFQHRREKVYSPSTWGIATTEYLTRSEALAAWREHSLLGTAWSGFGVGEHDRTCRDWVFIALERLEAKGVVSIGTGGF